MLYWNHFFCHNKTRLSFLQHSEIYRLSCRHTRQTAQAYIIEDYQNKE